MRCSWVYNPNLLFSWAAENRNPIKKKKFRGGHQGILLGVPGAFYMWRNNIIVIFGRRNCVLEPFNIHYFIFLYNFYMYDYYIVYFSLDFSVRE